MASAGKSTDNGLSITANNITVDNLKVNDSENILGTSTFDGPATFNDEVVFNGPVVIDTVNQADRFTATAASNHFVAQNSAGVFDLKQSLSASPTFNFKDSANNTNTSTINANIINASLITNTKTTSTSSNAGLLASSQTNTSTASGALAAYQVFNASGDSAGLYMQSTVGGKRGQVRTSSQAFGIDIQTDGYGAGANKSIKLNTDVTEISNDLEINGILTAYGETALLGLTGVGGTLNVGGQANFTGAAFSVNTAGSISLLSASASSITSQGALSLAVDTGLLSLTSGAGDIALTTGTGAISFTLGGGAFEITSGGGALDFQTAGGAVTVGVGAGDITLAAGTGSINLTTGLGAMAFTLGGGAFALTTGGGALSLQTGGGAMTLAVGVGLLGITAGLGTISMTTQGGDVIVGAGDLLGTIPTYGQLSLTAGFGNVLVQSSYGAINVLATGGGVNVGSASEGDLSQPAAHFFCATTNSGVAAGTGNITFVTRHAGSPFTGPGNFSVDTSNAFTGNITLRAKGAFQLISNNGASTGGIRLRTDASNASSAVYDYYFPSGPGTSGQVLTSSGTGAAQVWSNALLPDANNNLSVNNLFLGSFTLSTSSYTLAKSSPAITRITSASAPTITLPNATTLSVGTQYYFDNLSSVTATINRNGGTTLTTSTPNTYTSVTLMDNSTTAGVWSITGSVTSVGMTVPSFLSVSPSTITSSGTFAVTLSGTALPVLNGGTGVTTSTGSGANALSTAPSLLSPVLTPNGTSPSLIVNSSSSAVVTGASATSVFGGQGEVIRFTGGNLNPSGFLNQYTGTNFGCRIIMDANNLLTGSTSGAGSQQGGSFAIDVTNTLFNWSARAAGGVTSNSIMSLSATGSLVLNGSFSATGSIQGSNIVLPGSTSGQIVLSAPATPTSYSFVLPSTAGTTGQVLTSAGGSTMTWTSISGLGTVTSVGMTVPSFLSVTPATITTSGTFAVTLSGTALPVANGGTGTTTSTGTGSVVLNTTPTILTPVIQSNSTGSTTINVLDVLAPSVTASTNTYANIRLGTALSTNNIANIGLQYIGAGNSANKLRFSIEGGTGVVTINNAGNLVADGNIQALATLQGKSLSVTDGVTTTSQIMGTFLSSGATSSTYQSIVLGANNSAAYNCGFLQFFYSGSNSTSNRISLGVRPSTSAVNATNTLDVYYDGKARLADTFYSNWNSLAVNRSSIVVSPGTNGTESSIAYYQNQQAAGAFWVMGHNVSNSGNDTFSLYSNTLNTWATSWANNGTATFKFPISMTNTTGGNILVNTGSNATVTGTSAAVSVGYQGEVLRFTGGNLHPSGFLLEYNGINFGSRFSMNCNNMTGRTTANGGGAFVIDDAIGALFRWDARGGGSTTTSTIMSLDAVGNLSLSSSIVTPSITSSTDLTLQASSTSARRIILNSGSYQSGGIYLGADYLNNGLPSWGSTNIGNSNLGNCLFVGANQERYLSAAVNANGVVNISQTSSNNQFLTFYAISGSVEKLPTSAIGSVATNVSGGVVYSTTSDYRIKSDVQPLLDGLDIVKKLEPVSFYLQNSSSLSEGFIAHKVQEHIPNAVIGEKDAVDSNGTPKLQQLSMTVMIPYLVKAIQELSEKVGAQQTLIDSLLVNQ